MPRLRVISGKKLIRIFEDFGFTIVGQKGSHIKMYRSYKGLDQTLVIPNHASIAKGTLKDVYKQALEYLPEDDLRPLFYS